MARQKGQLVAKSYSEVPGYDFRETFSPIVESTTIRIIHLIVVTKHWSLCQVDVNNAFLNRELTKKVYM